MLAQHRRRTAIRYISADVDGVRARWFLIRLAVLAFILLLPRIASADPAQDGASPESQEVRGGLRAELDDGTVVDFPLTDLAVRGNIDGNITTVSVEQTYENPFDQRIEAVYTFPLPEDAAVYEMVMVVGERRIRSVLKEKEEAKRTYEKARHEGKSAALLDQERPNVFTQKVANIEPGHPIKVLISYVDQVPFRDGRYHYAFPLVVGPRYVSGTPKADTSSGTGVIADTDEVPDASRVTPPVLPEGERVPYDVDFEMTLDAGLPLHDLRSPSHDLVTSWHDEHSVTITLPADQRTPNRDIVFSYSLAQDVPAVGVQSHHDERGGFFTLMVQPPVAIEPEDVRPRELVFVLDTSGSMGGQPMDVSKRLMHHAIDNLQAGDTFRIVRFSSDTGAMSADPLSQSAENLAAAHDYIDNLEASGGTELEAGVRAALQPARNPDQMRVVLFLTDGWIGSDDRAIDLVDELIGDARLFSVGVGSAPNRYLLDNLARMGRGDAHYVAIDEDPTAAVAEFYRRIDNPVFTDIDIDWGDLDVTDVSPAPLPDVFAGTPLVVTGRYDTPGTGQITVSGLHGTTPTDLVLDVELAESADAPSIPFIWARRTLADIERDRGIESENKKKQIIDLSLEYSLLTKHTSFVAVDERIAADAEDPLRTVQVAVNLPHGTDDAMIGIQVTPTYVQPGDPEILVRAPADAVAVTAFFPFDLVQSLTFDPVTEAWTSRFLVPRAMQDGRYYILVIVERADGRVIEMEVPFDVDSIAPRMEARIDNVEPEQIDAEGRVHVDLDDRIHVRAEVLEPEETLPPDNALGGIVIPDQIKFLRIHLPDGRQVRMLPDEADSSESEAAAPAERWHFWFRHRPSLGLGTFTMTIEAVDVAGNATLQTIQYEVHAPGA